jgi:cell fate regulator YaaT (PSP1 superfamily)
METVDYLVTYGAAGEFSRFRPAGDRAYARGDRVVIRTSRGLELGTVLCRATAHHAAFLSRTPQGELLRPASQVDLAAASDVEHKSAALIATARRLAREMGLAIEILDAEITLDGGQASIFHLRAGDCDCRPLAAALSRETDVQIVMENMAEPASTGCGRPDCGKGAGGCSSCGTGGCSSGSCSAGHGAQEVSSHLAALRRAMESRASPSPLGRGPG